MAEPRPRVRKQEQEPASVEITEVVPAVLRLQLPIALPGLGHVNCYAFEDDRGVALVDPGLPGPTAWRALLDRLHRAGFPLRQVHTVVVTHSHPDHFGAAGRLQADAGADLVTSRAFRTWWDPADGDGADDGDRPARAPWEQPVPWGGRSYRPPWPRRLRYRLMRSMATRWVRPPRPTRRLEDAEPVTLGGREWVAVHTPGHTPDHLCLFDPAGRTLLSGDHVLPTITPHIGGIGAGPDPLTEFLASLDRVRSLDDVEQVLPAHGHPFTDLVGRVDAIHRHHDDRLASLARASADLGPATVEQLSRAVFPRRAWGAMAESETYAHLEHLRLGSRAERRDEGDRLLYVVAAD